MKRLLVVILSVLSLSAISQEHHHHPTHTVDLSSGVSSGQNICSELDENVCAHIGFRNGLSTDGAQSFVGCIIVADTSQVSDLDVYLWMEMPNGHAHGSAPLSITDRPGTETRKRFSIENAWFVMTGMWQVIMEFSYEGQQHKIVLPVLIEN